MGTGSETLNVFKEDRFDRLIGIDTLIDPFAFVLTFANTVPLSLTITVVFASGWPRPVRVGEQVSVVLITMAFMFALRGGNGRESGSAGNGRVGNWALAFGVVMVVRKRRAIVSERVRGEFLIVGPIFFGDDFCYL